MGLSIARELKRVHPGSSIALIEKERDCGLHASGRNSGVLHAGFYYSADSLKARFTKMGNAMLTQYCESRNIRINRCGKIVVARDENDFACLDELLKRARANQIELFEITEKEAKEIEPRVKTFKRAAFSPSTSTVNPRAVMEAIKKDAVNEGIKLNCGVKYLGKGKNGIETSAGVYKTGYCVNAAGLYADRIAMDYGFSERYRLLPFKGLYLYSDEPAGSLRTNIYPVPDLKNPFLGVHFTVTSENRVKIGPTAIPAFWREQYGFLQNFNIQELFEIVLRELNLFAFSEFSFAKLAFEELRKYSRERMVNMAGALAGGVKRENFSTWGKPGIRAQLVDVKKKKLKMDFVIEGDDRSMHVLNAVSPAFTCSIPFSKYVVEEITTYLN